VHGFVGTDGRRDVGRVARVLSALDADVVGLQEVARGPDDRLARLARATGHRGIYGATRLEEDGQFGNALLTRLPVDAVERHDVSVPGREARGLLSVRLRRGSTTLRVLVTHFGLRFQERAFQVAAVLALLRRATEDAVVLMGDFNEWRPRAVALVELHAWFGWAPSVRSFPSRLPLFALDRIWAHPREALGGFRAHRAAEARVASDHLPVCADLRLGR
jgi:endonuclease/exonuclease/phosphatase family metal-dependent hydrolase